MGFKSVILACNLNPNHSILMTDGFLILKLTFVLCATRNSPKFVDGITAVLVARCYVQSVVLKR